MKTRLSPRDLALTLAVVAVWGYTFVPIKVALTEVGPFTLAALRFFLAAVPMVFFVRPPAMPWRHVVAYGFAIGVCQFGLLFLGIKLGMPAGLSSLVIQMQVFFTIGLAVVYAGDRLHRHNLLGAAIATAGMVVLAGYKLASGLTGTLAGFALVIGAAFAWAVGNIIAKRGAGDHGADMFALTVWSSLVPPLPLAALAFAFEGGTAVFGDRRVDERRRVGLRAGDVLRRDAVRLRLVERAAAPLSDRAHLAVRAADPGVGARERRARSWASRSRRRRPRASRSSSSVSSSTSTD